MCFVKQQKRSVALSARNLNDIEDLNITTTRNSAYGQVKDSQLTQDGSVIHEATIEANVAYGCASSDNSRRHSHLYENPDEVARRDLYINTLV